MKKGQFKVLILTYESSRYKNLGYRLGKKFNKKINGNPESVRYAYKNKMKIKDFM